MRAIIKHYRHASVVFFTLLALLLQPALRAEPRDCTGVRNGVVSVLAPKRQLGDIETLRVGTYNVENLFARAGKAKPEQDTAAIEKILAKENLDIIALQEVENISAVRLLIERPSLRDKYDVHLIEGNDSSGIDIGFIVKRDLPFRTVLETRKDDTWIDPLNANKGPQKLFSRDLPILKIFAKEQAANAPPIMVLIGTHFKSKRDRSGDPESAILRQAQIERTADIIDQLRQTWPKGNGANQEVPIVLLGDFNGDLNMGRLPNAVAGQNEFLALYQKARLQDTFDLGTQPAPLDARITHTYHPHDGPTHKTQMDGILVNAAAASAVRSSQTVRYVDENGQVLPIPNTYDRRRQQPSDHFMLRTDFHFPRFIDNLIGIQN